MILTQKARMRKKLLLLLWLMAPVSLFSQILTWSPLFPTVEDTITIIYDAAQGNRGLLGATEVYAYTGLLTEKSTASNNWLYIKTAWSVHSPETRMESLGNNKWKIRFHIRSYYGVPTNEKVLQLAFVFRNGNNSREGKTATGGDIFLPIYEQGLQLTLLTPTATCVFVKTGESLPVMAAAQHAARLSLYVDEKLQYEVSNDSLSYSLTAGLGKRQVRITAQDSSGAAKSISFSFIVHDPQRSAELPSGLQDGITYSSASATLVLHAPRKQFVYVIGDFNNWEPRPEHMMNRTPDSSRYWLKLAGLQPGKEYIFQYLIDGDLRVADPYVQKISDPWNDAAIAAATYPGLLPYPTGKTTEIAGVLQCESPAYSWQDGGYVKPQKTDLVIYELLLRDFLGRHDFKTLADTLTYLQRLGVNAVELMPISEFEGNSSWGYNPSFYFATDKYYGPKQDVQRFIDLAHQRGIAVIQDIVLNHSYSQSPLVRLYAADMAHNPWYNATSPNTTYSWGYDFNHTSAATQAFVDRVTSFWLNEYHVDGFRFDFSKGFTNTPGNGWAYDAARIAILKRMAAQIWSVDPAAYVILEHFTDNAEERELAAYGMLIWGNMNSSYNEATMGYHGGKSDLSGASYKARNWSMPHLVAYMESHDEERVMYKNITYGAMGSAYSARDLTTALQRVEAAAAFFLSIPGPKMLWQFGELGYDYSIDYNGRLGEKPLRWDYLTDARRKHLYDVMAALIRLRIEHPAFETSDFNLAVYPAVKRISLNHSSANFTIIGNFDITVASIDPAFQHTGWWYNYLSGDSILVHDSHAVSALQPGEYRIYSDKKIILTGPMTLASSPAAVQPSVFQLFQNYPNPFNSRTVIRYEVEQGGAVDLSIFNLAGQCLLHSIATLPAGAHEFIWDGCDETGKACSSGIYFLRVRYKDAERRIRMVMVK